MRESLLEVEYWGKEDLIKNLLINVIRNKGYKIPDIEFMLVGKKSACHITAIETYRNRKKANLIVKSEDLIKLII